MLEATPSDCYGYSLLPGSIHSVTSLVAAYNCESDLTDEHRADTYYRFSVDEWSHYVHEGFDQTNAKLVELNNQLSELGGEDQHTEAYIEALFAAMLLAMKTVQSDAGLERIEFGVIWLSDSGHGIITRSAQTLNSAEVFETFAAEFG